MWTQREEVVGGRHVKNITDMITLPCAKQLESGKLLHCTGAQLGAPWSSRGVGLWAGKEVQEGRIIYIYTHGFPGDSDGKESSCNVRSQGWEDPLEEGIATHSSNLALIIPWTEKPGSLQSMVLQRVGHGHDWATKCSTYIYIHKHTHKADSFCYTAELNVTL